MPFSTIPNANRQAPPTAPIPTYVPPKLKSVPVAGQPKPTTPRLQIPEAVAPIRIPTPDELGLHIPTPEELGLQPRAAAPLVAPDAPVDWDMVERTLDRHGATGYHLEKTASGYRFRVQLSSGVVTGLGASKGAAVRQAMSQLAP